MRKLIMFTLMILSILVLSACTDTKTSDDSVNVIFFTGRNATYVDSYFDVEVGSLIEEPESPTRPNFVFDGWYEDIQYTNEWKFDEFVIDKSTVLYAKWRSQNYTIFYHINEELGEEFVDISQIFYEFTSSENKYLPNLRRPGGTFKGWSLVPQSEYTLDLPLYRTTNSLPLLDIFDFELYPIFNNNKYLFQFRANLTGVSNPAPKTGVEYGVVITFLPTLADTTTHRFIGWYTSNGTSTGNWGSLVENGDYNTFTNNPTLYGRWELK